MFETIIIVWLLFGFISSLAILLTFNTVTVGDLLMAAVVSFSGPLAGIAIGVERLHPALLDKIVFPRK